MIHMYEIILEFNDIEHRTTKVATPRTNGFVERFNRTLLDEFFRFCFRKKLYESAQALQTVLDAWLHHCNYERPTAAIVTWGADHLKPLKTQKNSEKN